MDKYEYRVRAEEIKVLISSGKYGEAVKIADTIDWRRVKSTTMLCTISDLYKVNRRFEESKEILLLAYERYPGSRAIVYSLCELSIKMGEFVQAVEYYKEFVRIAPRDTGRYILQYRLYEAQDVSLEERIAVLEEFKKHDYREKWAYELAYLYHRVGLTTECVEEVDEMFLWFGVGKYVMKALELKSLHEPLSVEQQARYQAYKNGLDGTIDREAILKKDDDPIGKDISDTNPDMLRGSRPQAYGQGIYGQNAYDSYMNPQASPYNRQEEKQPTKPFYNTPEERNAVEQAAIDAGMPTRQQMEMYYNNDQKAQDQYGQSDYYNVPVYKETQYNNAGYPDYMNQPARFDTNPAFNYQNNPTGAYGQPNMGNPNYSYDEAPLRDTNDFYANQAQQYVSAIKQDDSEAYYKSAPQMAEPAHVNLGAKRESAYNDTPPKPVGYDTVNLQKAIAESMEQIMAEEEMNKAEGGVEEVFFEDATREFATQDTAKWTRTDAPLNQKEEPGVTIKPVRKVAPSHYDEILKQDFDGQISMVVPENSVVDDQITGQISIDDIMNRIKQQQRQRQEEEVAKRVQDKISTVISQYDEDVKYDLQKEMEKEVKRELMGGNRAKTEKNAGRALLSHAGNVVRPTTEPFVKAGAEGIKRLNEEQRADESDIMDLDNLPDDEDIENSSEREEKDIETNLEKDIDLKKEADIEKANDLEKESDLEEGNDLEKESDLEEGNDLEREDDFEKETDLEREGDFEKETNLERESDFEEETNLERGSDFEKETDLVKETNLENENVNEKGSGIKKETDIEKEDSEIIDDNENQKDSEELERSENTNDSGTIEDTEDAKNAESSKEPLSGQETSDDSEYINTSKEENKESSQKLGEFDVEFPSEDEANTDETSKDKANVQKASKSKSSGRSTTVVEKDESQAMEVPEYSEELVEMSLDDSEATGEHRGESAEDLTDTEDVNESNKAQKSGDKGLFEGETDTESETRELDTRIRVMTPEEKELFGPYIHHRKSRKQIIRAIDSLNMSPSTNNAIVTGEEGTGTINLAKGLIKSVQANSVGFSGKVAKITAQALNRKSVNSVIEKLDSGALIIQRAADMKTDTVDSLYKALTADKHGIIIVMEDNHKDMDRLLKRHPELSDCFNVRVDVEALDNESLVAYAKQYALEREYKIDNFGMLSLHSRIEEMQTIDHDVTISEVRDIVDDAIRSAEKKTISHFFDVVLNKRYDEEDMVILTEKDFERADRK